MRTNPHRALTPLALAVLELLHERAMHPYEMHQTIRDRYTDLVIKVRAGSLYHTVERLHRDELIEQVETGREGRRPERTVYAITETGRDEFRISLRDLIRHPTPEFPVFGAAVQMLHTLDRDEAAELLDKRTLARESEIAARQRLLVGLTDKRQPRIHLIEVEYAQMLAQAELDWIRQTLDDIRSGTLRWPADQPGREPGKETTP